MRFPNPFKRKAETKGLDFIRGFDVLGSRFSVPGERITTADISISTVIGAALTFTSRNITEPPIVIVDKNGEQIDGHPALAFFKTSFIEIEDGWRRNDWSAALSMIGGSLLVYDNAYGHKLRNQAGQVIGVDWLHPADVDVETGRVEGVIRGYRVGNRAALVDPRDMIHIREGVDPDNPLKGGCKLRSIARAVLTDNQVARLQLNLMNSPMPTAIVNAKAEGFTERQREEFKRKWQDKMGQGNGLSNIAFIDADELSVERLSYSPAELNLSEVPRLAEERIAAALNIPAIVLGLGAGLARSTFANYKEAREAATENYLVPVWNLIATALTEQLLPDLRTDATERIVFDLSQVRTLQDDKYKESDRIASLFGANIIDRAEAKKAVGVEVDDRLDEGLYAHMLKPTPTVPTGTPAAQQARRDAENGV